MQGSLRFAITMTAGLVALSWVGAGCTKKDDGAETVTGTGGGGPHGGVGGSGGGGSADASEPPSPPPPDARPSFDLRGLEPSGPSGGRLTVFPLDPGPGNTAVGEAKFEAAGGQVTLTILLADVAPGMHGVAIHQNGNCGPGPDGFPGGGAGGHWNPTAAAHGMRTGPHHLGDVGNLVIEEDGAGSLTLTTNEWTLGTGASNDVIGKSLVVHALSDDFTTQPDGAAGFTIACGVILRP
jgi:Cu-Zn family superoxide dismutase